MRGLPPPPEDVLQWQVTWEYNGYPSASSSIWIYSRDSNTAGAAALTTFLGDLLGSPLNDLLSVLPSSVSPGVSRLTSYGTAPLSVVTGSPGVFGAKSGELPLTSALVLTWATGHGGRGSDGHTWLPLAGEMMSPDGKTLNTIEWSSAVTAAQAVLADITAITPPWTQPVEQIVLSRQDNGAPLPVAGFSPVVYAGASPFAGTMRRRGGDSGRRSSSF